MNIANAPSVTIDDLNISGRYHSNRARRACRQGARVARERAPVDRGNHNVVDDETEDGGGREVNREARIAQMREAGDDHVLRDCR